MRDQHDNSPSKKPKTALPHVVCLTQLQGQQSRGNTNTNTYDCAMTKLVSDAERFVLTNPLFKLMRKTRHQYSIYRDI